MERDRRTGRSDRKRCSAGTEHTPFQASAERKRRWNWMGRMAASISTSHIRIVPENRSKGNLDPSRAPADIGIPFAGRDDRAVLPGSSGDGGWRNVVACAGLRHYTRGCNSNVRDHSVRKSRTRRGIRRRGKLADGEQPRHEGPCAPTRRARQRLPIMAS